MFDCDICKVSPLRVTPRKNERCWSSCEAFPPALTCADFAPLSFVAGFSLYHGEGERLVEPYLLLTDRCDLMLSKNFKLRLHITLLFVC